MSDQATKSEQKFSLKEIEEQYYPIWEERGYFEVEGNKHIQEAGKNFCIMLPPPNVTGSLHIGHALNHTLSDIMVRYKRMDGYRTLWQPGMDHAGIATQNVVEKQLLAQGIHKEELGREKFIEKVWEWKEKSGGMILNQMRRLGTSPSWSRTRFTMDEGLKNAVKEAFVELYEKGLIVRDNYMVNWCTHDGALSDIEVEYDENNGKLYHLKYPIKDSKEYVVVATTRPETYFGDTAVMVNPEDERYKHLVGKSVILPLINREIQIIADSHVDMSFGTGCVKVTPAHDVNDYEVGKRHDLEFITIFDKKGMLNDYAAEFKGLERLEARDKIVARLQEEGFVEKIEDYKNQVGKCYRCGNVVEPYISKQWFVKKEAAAKAIAQIDAGEAKFFPPQWKNNYDAWMRDLRDWCISRQLWWGHQIPVFYCEGCGHEWASRDEEQDVCPVCLSADIYQDPDVLDTWFSSALWPFSTLGWGNGQWGKGDLWHEEDMRDFYPNALMITGFDILFFWVARMLMMGEQFIDRLPFYDIYLHALVRDEHGNKMSKSRGNVVDPLEIVESHSCDAVRFTLAILAIQGRDIKLNMQQLEISKNFTNKLYNASKFLLMNVEKFDDLDDAKILTPLGKYMLNRFYACTKEVRENLDHYRFNDAATSLYRFLWGEFCDWGIELSKASKESISELGSIFKESMKLLSPFMPFISEMLYHNLSATELASGESIMVSRFPMYKEVHSDIARDFAIIKETIVAARRVKATIDMANQSVPMVHIKCDRGVDEALFKIFVPKLAKCESVEFISGEVKDAIRDVDDNVEVFLPISGIDLSPIISRMENQIAKLQKEQMKLSGMLNNENFVANAPADVLERNRSGLAECEEKLGKVSVELAKLKSIG